MKPLADFPLGHRRRIKGVLVDIDDTLTSRGALTAEAYGALENLHQAGFIVVPVTGRPAGWCDHIARMWPVEGVVGENGAFYFRHDAAERKLVKRYLQSAAERAAARKKLEDLKKEILEAVPGAGIASDQQYREADLAIDFCEDVPPLPPDAIDRIVRLFNEAGATAKVSSIHVNGWFGTYDKLTMTRIFLDECFAIDLQAEKDAFVFAGDSPNDQPMFDYFPNSVGVANVRNFKDRIECFPTYVTERESGAGFAELAASLIAARK